MIPYSQSYAKECEGEWIMKRVVCLLLSLILLLGLLPTALADGNGPNWVVLCNEDGTEREMRRTQELYNCMYGESVYFHLYADETGGEA